MDTLCRAQKKYFFKFHAEENETESLEKTEYYNAKILAEFGWPAVQPVFTSHKPGLQFVIYEYIDAPTAFDAYEEQELRRLKRRFIRRYASSPIA